MDGILCAIFQNEALWETIFFLLRRVYNVKQQEASP